MKRYVGALVCCLLSSQLLIAWNDAGHRAIALLAWSRLDDEARARATAILTAHPDLVTFMSPSPALRATDAGRRAFATASIWPDAIRVDSRFAGTNAKPESREFAAMGHRPKWHFINTPLPAAFAKERIDPENAVTQLHRLLGMLRKSGRVTVDEAYALSWIVHLVSDLHQPLHTVTRFATKAGKPVHDRGGNLCFVQGSRNLHSLWDGLLGKNSSDNAVVRVAVSLGNEFPKRRQPDTRPESWVREGAIAAEKFAYSFNQRCDDETKPAKLSPGYIATARNVARGRAAAAAWRLAAILNEKLGR